MFKFLRKYNKLILAVGGVLLMITFLIPQAITQLSETAGARHATRATIDNGRSVSALELEQAAQEVQLLQRLNAVSPGIGIVPGIGVIQSPGHWYLLVREAEQAGLVIAPGAVAPELVAAVAGNTGQPVYVVQQTLSKWSGVQQLFSLHETHGLYSDRRLREAANQLFHKANIQPVIIQADASKAAAEPSEEEIRAHFDQYANTMPGEGDYGFGYKLPNRVKLEWLTISADAVRRVAEQSDEMSGERLQMHWRRNPSGTFPSYQSGQPVPDVVRQDLLEQVTQKMLADITKFANDQMRLNRRGMAERDGYAVLPEGWDQKKISFTKLAESMQSRFGVALPAYESSGDQWLTIEDINQLGTISAATTDRFGQPLGLQQLVAAAKEFGGSPTILIQQDIAGPPLTDFQNNIYLFRITDTDPSRSPHSIDEVREQVVTDLKRLAHYRELIANASHIQEQVAREGFVSLAIEHDTVVHPVQPVFLGDATLIRQLMQWFMQLGQLPPVSPASLPEIGPHRDTIEAIIDFARTLPTTDLASVPEDQRTTIVPVDNQLAVVVALVQSQEPVTEQLYRDFTANNTLQMLVASEEFETRENETHPFSFEALAQRHNYVESRGTDELEDEALLDETATASASTR